MTRRSNRRSSQSSALPDKPEPTGFRRLVRRLFGWGVVLGLLGAGSLAGAVAWQVNQLPGFDSIKTIQSEQMIVVRARDGTQLVTIRSRR